MVIREHIYEREHPVTGSGIHYLVYPRQWEAILWTSIIPVGVINTDSPFTSLFWDNHHIYQPLWILNLSYKHCCQQLVYLSLNNLLPIQMEALDLLEDRL